MCYLILLPKNRNKIQNYHIKTYQKNIIKLYANSFK